MIKELIFDLTQGSLMLTQALTRAKVLAHKIDNQIFYGWVKWNWKGT
jgi:hypothetical protein